MDHLRQLCEDLELDPNLEKTKEGMFILPLTESITIWVKPLERGVYLYSPICPCPNVNRENLFILLMKANLFTQGTM